MKRNKVSTTATALLTAAATCVTTGMAQGQQIYGTPGSPSATTTIQGDQIPAPPQKFGGTIRDTAPESKPYWPARIVPPKGAPNVLLIMTDDSGYGVPSTFGGVIPTPALDRIAKAGLRYTQFHSTALSSPTRAAIITGRNHHSVGFGMIPLVAPNFKQWMPHAIHPLIDSGILLASVSAVVLNAFFNSFEQTDPSAPSNSVSIRASAQGVSRRSWNPERESA